MPNLHVALQEGFAHDPVAVSIAGVEVFRHADLSTRQQIGLAASFSASVAPGAVTLDVHLPKRAAAEQRFNVAVTTESWLGISLRPDGNVQLRVSATPFGYA